MSSLHAPSSAPLAERLQALGPARLKGMRRGLEKESLRAQPGGALALTPHPAALGSALTHPAITTDFSESQIELVTGAHTEVDAVLDELTQIHQFTYRSMKALGDEMLWVSSMPCDLPTKVFTAWACHTATAGACRRFRASTTTGRCPA
jgi:glutamate--cysteine ligase